MMGWSTVYTGKLMENYLISWYNDMCDWIYHEQLWSRMQRTRFTRQNGGFTQENCG